MRVHIPTLQRLDALDAFQLCKAFYALSLVIAALLDLPEQQVEVVEEVLAKSTGVPNFAWLIVLSLYTVASVLCFVWKNDPWQTGVSFASMFLWTFAGVSTLASPASPASGVFQLLLGLVSVFAMYFRGRKHR